MNAAQRRCRLDWVLKGKENVLGEKVFQAEAILEWDGHSGHRAGSLLILTEDEFGGCSF